MHRQMAVNVVCKMANPRMLCLVSVKNLLNNYGSVRCNSAIYQRQYSVFPKHYVKPIFRRDQQESVFQSEEAEAIAHQSIKPAMTTDTCSQFYDPKVVKFTNVLMRKGDKVLARRLVHSTFEKVKRIQLQRYHKAQSNEDKNQIELDPFVVFHRALENSTPILHLQPCKKGGITYQVPAPITEKKAQHTAMKWLIEAGNNKGSEERFWDILAKELVSASQNQGSAVRRKLELHKRCQENRAYAHFRWT